jgi:uncharacterized protein involved in outer membrane biogenesis
MLLRSRRWLVALLLALPLLAVLWIAIFGWNWARAPLQHMVQSRTGRALVIGGDLHVALGWPAFRAQAKAVTFANPPWAAEAQMLSVDDVEFTIDLPALLSLKLVFPQMHLTHPVVFLERAPDGRKTWLLDQVQSDESARFPIGRLTLDQGQLGYDDAATNTRIRVKLSTRDSKAGAASASELLFVASGIYHGLALSANGSGGPALALQDQSVPYPLTMHANVGGTGMNTSGSVTDLLRLTAVDMRLQLHGDSLAELFPLLGIALPKTRAYAMTGRLIHDGPMWRYEKFSGRLGNSDIAGTLQLDSGAVRPLLHGELVSQKLDFTDLGPVVGNRQQRTGAAAKSRTKVLPDIPFSTGSWHAVDADVTLTAASFASSKGLPLQNLVVHIRMIDALLTLDPLDFGFADGHLKAVISMDGRKDPIQAHARISARKVRLSGLSQKAKTTQPNGGEVNLHFDLSGSGNSVGRMLATSDGRIGLIVGEGELSKLLLEEISLHLLEMAELRLAGDQATQLRCGVADFVVKSGVMKVNALVLDTEVSTIVGNGQIDLGREQLDLTLLPKTHSTSPVSLRGPIYVHGPFLKPAVTLDKSQITARSMSAVALGLINPLLALIPLVEVGASLQTNCGQLIHDANTPLPRTLPATAPATPN